ncbi:hypothetical protein D3C76_1849900 [compost metagenome]
MYSKPKDTYSTVRSGRHSNPTSDIICAMVLTLPIQDTATLLRLPISAIHSRSDEMIISRAIMVAAGRVIHQV